MATLFAIAMISLAGVGHAQLLENDTVFVEHTSFGAFERATRITVGPQGWVYVVDAGSNGVHHFKDFNTPSKFVGGYGWTSFSFDDPSGLATDGLNLYVADRGNHRIQRYDRNLNFISSFSTRDTTLPEARFGYPNGAALSRLGDLFILDTENLRVVKFTAGSRFERSFGSIERERGKLQRPLEIAVSSDDRVYVLERNKVIEYDYFGNYLRTIGEGLFNDARGFDVSQQGVLVTSSDTLYWFSLHGEVLQVTPAKSILAGSSLASMQDVVLVRDWLYILISKQILVFKIVRKEYEVK